MMMKITHSSFYGLKVSVFDYEQLVCYITESLDSGKCKIYYGYSMGLIAKMKHQKQIYYCSNDFDLMVTDGRFLFLLSKYVGLPLKFDISIPYLTELVLRIGNKKRSSVMILGSTKEKNIEATSKLKALYKGLTVYSGYDGGSFDDDEFPKIVAHINRFKPDIVLVGVSSPKKEIFAYKNKENIRVKIMIPCGGMVDILAGQSKMIPRIIKITGFGWLWRLMCEPKRLWRLQIKLMSEICLRIVPFVIFKRNNKSSFFLPSIYGIKKMESKV
jgi:N-acetylglucosaminyldiphosphoundecaprenol N-acetyl-beta-D-mannosaminyltransferase